jgi:hypothetical protein
MTRVQQIDQLRSMLRQCEVAIDLEEKQRNCVEIEWKIACKQLEIAQWKSGSDKYEDVEMLRLEEMKHEAAQLRYLVTDGMLQTSILRRRAEMEALKDAITKADSPLVSAEGIMM